MSSKVDGNLTLKVGGRFAPDFDFRFGGRIEATPKRLVVRDRKRACFHRTQRTQRTQRSQRENRPRFCVLVHFGRRRLRQPLLTFFPQRREFKSSWDMKLQFSDRQLMISTEDFMGVRNFKLALTFSRIKVFSFEFCILDANLPTSKKVQHFFLTAQKLGGLAPRVSFFALLELRCMETS